ncbi:GNAT family N-acetyltransferase [Glycomyces xiaoerkulensis]|uniref:GNAT family N-acetyltransferase n=1 Tax=Glycomyces xiaoerkulensis TaxID=2038139 RepID=UPI0012FFED0F|nr:GNAT family N-acetyltransferase [Glycomyces xiaoerkulensis]
MTDSSTPEASPGNEDDVSVLVDPPVTAALVDELSHLWVRVTNAGGSVGFVPPVSLDRVRPHTVSILSRVIDQTDTLVALQEGAAIVAWCVLTSNDSPPRQGWRSIRHVQVDPERQGSGIGGKLLAAVDEVAREDLKLEALSLKVRSGTGADAFYRRHGFTEVGRLPRAVRVADDDYRDDIIMWRELS